MLLCVSCLCNALVSVLAREVNGVHTGVARPVDIKRELVMLSLPAIAGQAIDPLTLLMETAYIGRLGIFLCFSRVISPWKMLF